MDGCVRLSHLLEEMCLELVFENLSNFFFFLVFLQKTLGYRISYLVLNGDSAFSPFL